MKFKLLLTAVSASIALTANTAFADDEQKYNAHQNLSKRPYHQPLDNQAKTKDNFEGATLISEQAEINKKHQPMNLHNLGKRPFAEKNTD
ncbi:MAG: hypothetical protein Q8R74_12360 [Methylophilus sp.]|nr:hypothetical protein [Methylophilus sp.]